jgi:hypothetical protein
MCVINFVWGVFVTLRREFTQKMMVKRSGFAGECGRFFAFSLIFAGVFIASTSFASAVEPFGASVVNGTPQRAPVDTAGNTTAFAGNITELSITGYSVTQSWQGYFGNVTGTIQLANANDQVLYNWTLASPQGEVYSSTNSTIAWGSIQCFNHTANGTQGGSSGETAGATSVGGTNMSQLEARFGIVWDDVDGVNETFYLKNHDQFYTANLQFSADECQSTRVYGQSGPTDQQFEEVLLYEPATSSVIFASLLEDTNTVVGFNGQTSDFEMLVLENGHGTDVSTTTYFFFVELE